MCGRYGQFSRRERIEALLGMKRSLGGDTIARYNITPGTCAWIVRWLDTAPRLDSIWWGLLPSWAADPKRALRPANARAETVAAKPMFRKLVRERRCLVPADGYYEWKTTPTGKIPHWIYMRSGEPFFFAGLWDEWHAGHLDAVPSFTLMTTDANELTRPIHDRMPVIVRPEDYKLWLDPAVTSPAEIAHVLKPYASEEMTFHQVSRRVNMSKNEGRELIAPVAEPH